jgi:hypothetical protein
MKGFFDPHVDRIIELIQSQRTQVTAKGSRVKVRDFQVIMLLRLTGLTEYISCGRLWRVTILAGRAESVYGSKRYTVAKARDIASSPLVYFESVNLTSMQMVRRSSRRGLDRYREDPPQEHHRDEKSVHEIMA